MKNQLIYPEQFGVALQECPFCGGDPFFRVTQTGETNRPNRYDIICPQCMKLIHPYYDGDPILAAAEWNERNKKGRTIDPERVMEDFEEAQYEDD